jgi:hypothetical protein
MLTTISMLGGILVTTIVNPRLRGALALIAAACIVVASLQSLGTPFVALTVAAATLAALLILQPRFLPRTPAVMRLLPWLAVGALIASMFATSITAAYEPQPRIRKSTVELLTGTPPIDAQLTDQAIYLAYVRRVAAGENYYAAAVSTLDHVNRAWPKPRVDISSPLSVRPPLLFIALAQLPTSGVWIVIAELSFGAIAAIAGFMLARRYVLDGIALIAPALICATYGGYSVGLMPMNPEIWAGALALVAMEMLLHALDHERLSIPWIAGAAAITTIAACIRELAAAYLLLGLVTTLAKRQSKRVVTALPWLGGFAILYTGFEMHARAAKEAAKDYTAYHFASRFPWWYPDGLGLVATSVAFSMTIGWPSWAGWIIVCSAVLGVCLAPRKAYERILLGGTVIGGLTALSVLHPPGQTASGLPLAYWSGVIVPVVMACVPLAFARFAPARAYSPVVETPMSSAASSSVH